MAGLEPRKLFVGALPRTLLTSDTLRAHFARYGEVVDAVVMLNPMDGFGRGFGFVEFTDEDAVERALDCKELDKHVFEGKKADVKRAKTKTRAWQSHSTTLNTIDSKSPIGDTKIPAADPKKIFVGGLRDSITQDDLSDYFQKFGKINDVVVMLERLTRKPRGFGFVTFDSQESADKVLKNKFHELNGIKVETKIAEPRDPSYRNGQHHGYRGSMTRGYMSPASSYGGMYSPHSVPYHLMQNGHFMVPAYPYIYPLHGAANYGYMMNQTATSSNAGVMAMQGSPMMYPDYGRSYTPLNHRGLSLESSPAGMMSDLVISDSDNLL